MKLQSSSVLISALALAASPSRAQITVTQSIGVYSDPFAGNCGTTVLAFSPGTMYVVAVLYPSACAGISGAEFRVDNFPSEWFPISTPNVEVIVVTGNPLAGGAYLGFPGCQMGNGGVVLLYTIRFFATSSRSDVHLEVRQSTTPRRPEFQCPVLFLCDAPTFTGICVPGRPGLINSPQPCCLECAPGNCNVAIEPRAWSRVKKLYE